MHSWPCRHGLGWELVPKAEPGEEGERETADGEEAEVEGKVQDTQGSGSWGVYRGKGAMCQDRCSEPPWGLPGRAGQGAHAGSCFLVPGALFHLMVTVRNDPPQYGLA